MSFSGETYNLVLNGKFNGNENVDLVPAGDSITDSRNIDTHNGVVEKRGGTQKVTTAISGNPGCLGLGQLVTKAGTKYRYFTGTDGKIYRDEVSVKTGRSVSAKNNLTPISDAMYIANGVDVVQVDTGTAIANITTPAADWSGTSQPAVFVLHNRGLARRNWGVNVTGFKNTAYYSTLGTFQQFAGGTSGTVNVDIQEGNGIVTAISFGENLYFFGRRETFILEDSNVDPATWGVFKAPFDGGVYSPQLLVQAPNDLYAMMENGEIYSILRAEQLRDYKRASISRPHFIHSWIKNNVDLSKIADFHAVYDPSIEAVRFWMTRTGQTKPDVCLKYYVFEGVWGPPDDAAENNATNGSGFKAGASCVMNIGVGDDRVCTGDQNGFIWKLNDSTKTDDGNAYTGVWSSSWLSFDAPRDTKRFVRALLNYLSRGAYVVSVRWFVDGNAQTTASIDLGGVGSSYGSAIYGTSVYAAIGIEESEMELGEIGRKIRFTISNDGVGEDFGLSYILLDFMRLGAQVR